MATPENITFSVIINTIKNYIKTNCQNVANYAGMPAQYKAGYSRVAASHSGGHVGEQVSVTLANPVAQITGATVDSDMTEFLNNTGVLSSALDYPVDSESLLKLLNNLAIFCTTRICFAMSNSVNYGVDERILVYSKLNNIDYDKTMYISPRPLGSGIEYTINTENMNEILNNFLSNVKSSLRVHPVKFNYVI